MNNFLRTIIAGYGAKKLGGGCLSTILIFFVIYYALGTCNRTPQQTTQPQHSSIIKKPAGNVAVIAVKANTAVLYKQ